MAYATDRDCLVLEPNVFRDLGFASQRLVQASDGAITGATLSSMSSNFSQAQVDAGHVILVDSVPLEVVERLTDHSLTVSRLRPDPDGDAIPPSAGSGLNIEVMSFAPQIEMVHRQVLRSIGIEPEGIDSDLTEDDVLNWRDFVRLETIGSLHLLFAGASSLIGERGTLWNKSELYRQRFEAVRRGLSALIDTNGDGESDVIRYLNVVQFVRG